MSGQKKLLSRGAKRSVDEVSNFYTKIDRAFQKDPRYRKELMEEEYPMRRLKVLKNRPKTGDKPYFISPVLHFCVPGPMSTCSKAAIWEEQEPCFFSEKSGTGPRCMYFIESCGNHCDCTEAQKLSLGQDVDLKKFEEDKKYREAMGDTDIWDEKKIIREIKKIFDTKKLKYDEMPIEVLQERVDSNKLYLDGASGLYLDLERNVYYSGGGTFLKEHTRKRIEQKVRQKHDLYVKYNIKRDVAIEDVLTSEFDDYMDEVAEPTDFITDIDVVELHKVDGIYFDKDKKVYVVKSTGGMYEHRHHTNVYDLVGRQ